MKRNLRYRLPNRRGQIQMFETIAVLLVFLLILAFGVGFYFFIAKAGAARAQIRAQEAMAVENAQRLSTLPELDCVKAAVQKERCVDELKVEALTTHLEDEKNADYYFETFGFSKVVLRKVYPASNDWQIYDHPRAKFSGLSLTQLPLLFYSPYDNSYAFGVLEVTTYD